MCSYQIPAKQSNTYQESDLDAKTMKYLRTFWHSATYVRRLRIREEPWTKEFQEELENVAISKRAGNSESPVTRWLADDCFRPGTSERLLALPSNI
jgi:hypothetical protein